MKKAALILLIFIIPIAAIVFIILFQNLNKVTPPRAVAITMWGFNDLKVYEGAIANYHSQHPYATITYTQVSPDNLRTRLLEAWAVGAGPDLFEFPAEQTKALQALLTPAPATTTSYTYARTKQLGIKEELKITKAIVPGPTPMSIRQEFVDTVNNDVTIGGQVYGLPMTMESLVLFSNRTLLNQARIPFPAKTWNDFVQQVPTLTLFDSKNNLLQSGTSLGTDANVRHAEDILALLIMQNGGMVSSGQTVLLDQAQSNAQAVEFYTDFARPTKVVYGWNDKQKDSLTAFAEGKVAYYLGFTSDESAIIERGAGLQYDITEVPQVNIQRPLTIAKYNLLGVAKSAKNAPATWNFLQWLTGKTGATLVLNQSLATPARKDLVQALLGTTNPAITVKVGQTLVATSWYSGSNDAQARIVLKELIRTVSTGSMATLEALTDASQKLRLFIK